MSINTILLLFHLGYELSKIEIFKNGQKLQKSDNVHVDMVDEVITLLVEKVSVEDEAAYTVRVQNSSKDHGEVTMTVITGVNADETDRYAYFVDILLHLIVVFKIVLAYYK